MRGLPGQYECWIKLTADDTVALAREGARLLYTKRQREFCRDQALRIDKAPNKNNRQKYASRGTKKSTEVSNRDSRGPRGNTEKRTERTWQEQAIQAG